MCCVSGLNLHGMEVTLPTKRARTYAQRACDAVPLTKEVGERSAAVEKAADAARMCCNATQG